MKIADKANTLMDEKILQIGNMAIKYIATNNLVDKTLALPSVEYFDGKKRELKKKHRDMKYYKEKPGNEKYFLVE